MWRSPARPARDSTELARGREEIEKLFAGRVHEDAEHVTDSVPIAETASVDAFGSLSSAEIQRQPASADAGTATDDEATEPALTGVFAEARAVVDRCRLRMATIHADDQEDAIGLIEEVESAIAQRDADATVAATKALNDFLFFIEGR